MDKLGSGNMYVHIVTFILLCMAPYWIFTLVVVNIDNENIREGLDITGIIICMFGLLYGGFWRIHMWKRFGLPGNGWCCGQPDVIDLVQWLFYIIVLSVRRIALEISIRSVMISFILDNILAKIHKTIELL
jgi:Cys-rich protein (TIGR01571 family)